MITQSRIKEILNYNEETGVFTWKIRCGCRGIVGTIAGSIDREGYVKIGVLGGNYLAHRIAILYVYGAFPEFDTDHINGVKGDNRLSNLRCATRSENKQNIRKPQSDNKTGVLGVSKKRGRWIAQIKVAGVKKHLGVFDTPELAHSAYLSAKRIHHPMCTI